MKHTILILAMSLAALGTASVSHAYPPPQAQVYELPTIKKEMAFEVTPYALASCEFAIVAEADTAYKFVRNHLDIAIHSGIYIGEVTTSHETDYHLRYKWRNKGLLNYWPGYTRIV